MVRVTLVPAATLTNHVKGLEVAELLIVVMGGADKSPAGMTVRMKGATPPCQVN